jgi:hypothetical protein
MKPERAENIKSVKGIAHVKPSAGSGKIKSEEHVGSTGSGIRFKLPSDSDCTDHSKVRSLG